MTCSELRGLLNGLIAYCQRQGVLTTDSDKLADELQELSEAYISKAELVDFLEG